MISIVTSLSLVEAFISIAMIQQTLELLKLKNSFSEQGVWSWSTLRNEYKDFPKIIRGLFDIVFQEQVFYWIIFSRLVLAFCLLFTPYSLFVLPIFIISLLICVRWRGTFNGGSDYMSLIVLVALSLTAIFGSQSIVGMGCLWYVTIQTISSYFISGIIKLKSSKWRNGQALLGFFSSNCYSPTPTLLRLVKLPWFAKLCSWSIIIFECSFPLALLGPKYAIGYIGLGVVFHLFIFVAFGLNRFFFAWSASYPALFFCSQLYQLH